MQQYSHQKVYKTRIECQLRLEETLENVMQLYKYRKKLLSTASTINFYQRKISGKITCGQFVNSEISRNVYWNNSTFHIYPFRLSFSSSHLPFSPPPPPHKTIHIKKIIKFLTLSKYSTVFFFACQNNLFFFSTKKKMTEVKIGTTVIQQFN